jgi:cephalosporin hydroxylase
VIAYGTAVTDDRLYRRFALAGIESAAAPGDLVMTRHGTSLQRGYNEMMDEAAGHDDLEALVLVHQDLRIEDPAFVQKLRAVLADESIGVAGSCGANGVSGMAWFEDADMIGGMAAQFGGRVMELGTRLGAEIVDVEAVDGALLVLSPWAVRELSFDPSFEADFHGYDTDISLQSLRAGKRVVTAELWAVHDSLGKIGPRRGSWIRASLRFDRKWARWLEAETAARADAHPAAFRVSEVRRQIRSDLELELESRRRVWPAPGTGALPPALAFDRERPAREHWRARLVQHTQDSYAGVPMAKLPEDLRVYEHLIWSSRADTVIELGSFCGGSALWFRDRLAALGRYRGGAPPQVVTIDREIGLALSHLEHADPAYTSTIVPVAGDVCDPELPDRVARLLRPGARCLVIEDSAHVYETTFAALDGFARFVPGAGFFVVEDGLVDDEELRLPGSPVGVLPALADWLETAQGVEFTVREDLELYGFTGHPGGFLQRRASSGGEVGHP